MISRSSSLPSALLKSFDALVDLVLSAIMSAWATWCLIAGISGKLVPNTGVLCPDSG
jgi:hypothetical protein